MVYRAYVEKKSGLDNEARSLKNELVSLLGIKSLENLRILNRYDVENISKELFDYSKQTVLSEPQLDEISEEPNLECDRLFAVEFLPGQFDQRADSAAQCIQLISQGEKPDVRSARVYMIYFPVSLIREQTPAQNAFSLSQRATDPLLRLQRFTASTATFPMPSLSRLKSMLSTPLKQEKLHLKHLKLLQQNM